MSFDSSSYVQTSCGVQGLCPSPLNTSNICPSPTFPWKPTSVTVPIRNGLRSVIRWQIGSADISEAEVTGMQRFNSDKPLLLWLWSSPQSSLVLPAWKSYDSVFLCKKISETETQSALNFSALEEKSYLTSPECIPVNIWSWSISALRLNFSFWLWPQMNNFAMYEQYIHIYSSMLSYIVSASKATDFFLLHFLSVCHVPDHSVLAESHSGDSSSCLCFQITKRRAPIDVIWCGIPAEDAQEER